MNEKDVDILFALGNVFWLCVLVGGVCWLGNYIVFVNKGYSL